MANIFNKTNDYVKKPGRNTFDLSFQNNLTMKFGNLYPVMCKPVVPGDSFRIRPTFNFNFMPMIFPVQTRMKANLHFFYVRNRNLWKDWPDFIGDTKDGLTLPYIYLNEENRDIVNTGMIGDFMGIPTVTNGIYGSTPSEWVTIENQNYNMYNRSFNDGYSVLNTNALNVSSESDGYKFSVTDSTFDTSSVFENLSGTLEEGYVHGVVIPLNEDPKSPIKIRVNPAVSKGVPFSVTPILCIMPVQVGEASFEMVQLSESISVGNDGVDIDIVSMADYIRSHSSYPRFTRSCLFLMVTNNPRNQITNNLFQYLNVGTTGDRENVENSDLDLVSLPFANELNPDGLRISALPFRAYESIYNSFYRDSRNNPYMLDGVPEYNKYLQSVEGGADTFHYGFHQKNWEADFLTSAVQSPQQGIAPLVGVTSTGEIKFQDDEGKIFTAQMKVGPDGDTVTGISEVSEGMPTGNLRMLVDAVSSGISINDFRNVNALQRWLEVNMRRGLRYRDQIKSHFGVDVEYKELDMPEFIGGVSEDVLVNRISQTSDDSANGVPLGTLGGQAGVLGTSKHDISHYCDEHGYIIGILSITPVPNYSQLLPKDLLKSTALDYYTPEFAHIGMQPIFYNEVTPLQVYRDDLLQGTDNLHSVFGYQRAWYEYLQSQDEVHGAFRNNMRNYLINRVFDVKPELGEDFLTVKPEQINDIFAVTDDSDKIFGQIYFDIKAKRPIPEFGIPKLEA